MSDRQYGQLATQGAECLAYRIRAVAVECAGCFVENQQLRAAYQRASDHNPLTLSAGQFNAALADLRRVLRPGGRLAVSDVVMTRKMADSLLENPEAYCGCVSGAAPVEDLTHMLQEAGFASISIVIKPESREIIGSWFPGSGVENCVASANIQAQKAGGCCCGH